MKGIAARGRGDGARTDFCTPNPGAAVPVSAEGLTRAGNVLRGKSLTLLAALWYKNCSQS